ncbi:cobalt/nickel transport system permease protein [Desulfotomaculum arcticum]|uniref:Cobalt/nickel transport system permease protein n=1 Tax=Desulfotruncus arcticus DSM 17038 TaxID=1121424 RepID=A0A1I2SUR5_9FIRM|nr:energy-coupling factor ABC transporter permease [Desulfotruncus arcticus]SFG56574.1 cobalt/nickel transport system permease protein [Desulfotomaculum arcticum] [Desulfotruncus arcticus DSM 17038]
MHIPDGFLDTKTWISTYALSAGALAYSIKKSKEVLEDKLIPKLGIMAAFIFAAQMVNFPIAGGTSGHLLGAALATVLLGPVSGCLILSTVLVIQCLAFQDGGLTALGGNIFNMAVLGVITAYVAYSLLSKVLTGTIGRNISVFLAAWLSVVIAAFGATMELAASNTIPFSVALPAMVGVHMLIGIGEGLITVAVVNFVEKVGFIDKTAKIKNGVRSNV